MGPPCFQVPEFQARDVALQVYARDLDLGSIGPGQGGLDELLESTVGPVGGVWAQVAVGEDGGIEAGDGAAFRSPQFVGESVDVAGGIAAHFLEEDDIRIPGGGFAGAGDIAAAAVQGDDAQSLGAVGGGPLWEEGRGIGKPAAPQSPPFIGPGQQSASPEQRR